MNLTLYSLITSHLLSSPMIAHTSFYDKASSIKVDQLSANNFFSNFLFSHSNTVFAEITRSKFVNFMHTPLIFKSFKVNGNNFCSTENLTYQNFNECEMLLNSETFSDVYIIDCTFENNAKTQKNCGGAIYYTVDGSLTVFGTFFRQFSAYDGGAIFAAKEHGESGTDMKRPDAKRFLSHYCCYSSCSASQYGSAALIAANDLQFNFSSSINCPELTKKAKGAQFDLQSHDSIASSNINSTSGSSQYCASLEYRNAKHGFYKFQTIVNQKGGFITSFTSLESDVDISNCNIVNATLTGGLENNAVPGVLHVRHKNIKVSDFFFFGINFNNIDKSRLITYQTGQTELRAELINSYAQVPGWKIDNIITNNVHTFEGETEITTQFITQLYLGDCKGILSKPPPPIVPEQTPLATPEETPFATPAETPEETPFATPVETPEETVNITDEPDVVPREPPKQKGGGSKTPLIAGISAGVIAAIAAIAIAIFFIIRHNRMKIPLSELDLEETNTEPEVNQANPLYNKAADDPFKDDFVGT